MKTPTARATPKRSRSRSPPLVRAAALPPPATFLPLLPPAPHRSQRPSPPTAVKWSIHPGVASRGLAKADPGFRKSVDEALADFWCAVFEVGRDSEATGTGALIRRAGLSAAPYLVRLGRWAAVSTLLEQVIVRDETSATAAAVLPWFEIVVQATTGTPEELFDRGKLAKALDLVGRTAEAETEMRQIVDAAVATRQFRVASAMAGSLINLLRASGRLDEALALAADKSGYTQQAGLGPWTQLLDEGKRLRILSDQGHNEEVLQSVFAMRDRLDSKLEVGKNETAIPWDVRETIFDIGRSAALQMRQWQTALDLNQLIGASRLQRGADALEIAKVDFNDYTPLITLKKYDAVRVLLEGCRETFRIAANLAGVGHVLSALANLEHELHGAKSAQKFEARALRYHYLTSDPQACAISHFNLSNYFMQDVGTMRESLAHRLAAIMIGLFCGSSMLQKGFDALNSHLVELGAAARPIMPTSFASFCETVEAVEGVHFRDLISSLDFQQTNLDALVGALVEKGFALVSQYHAEVARANARSSAEDALENAERDEEPP